MRQFACDLGSFTHIYTNTGVYTITASTIDGSFTGTQNVNVDYQNNLQRLVVTPSTDVLATGGTLTLSATLSDPAGHHVQEWYVNWGDGTSQAFGSVGDTDNPSDSSTDGTDADPASTDSETFTHVYPTGRMTMGYNFAVYAVTDENAYGYANDVEVTNVNPFSDDFAALPYNTTPGEFGEGIIDGLHDAGLNIFTSEAGNFTIDWGDGTQDAGIALTPNSNGVIVLPTAYAHDYAIEGTYLVTVTDHTNDGQTLFAHLPVFADSPIASIATAAPVVGAGANLGTEVPVTDGDSQDPLFAVMQWTNSSSGPAGPHVVAINNGAIDLTNVAAPSYTSDWAMNLTVYNGDVGEQTDAPGGSAFPVYVWSVVIDNGERNDVLIAGPVGMQSLQPVTLNFPHPAGEALNLTLATTDYMDDDLWPTNSPSAGDTPLIGKLPGDELLYNTGPYSFSAGPSVTSQTFFVGAINGNTTAGVLQYKLSGTTDIGNSTGDCLAAEAAGTVGSVPATQPVVSNRKSDVGVTITLVSNPNTNVAKVNVTDNSQNPTNWLVGQIADLVANVVGPAALLPANPKFQWHVPGDVLYNYKDDNNSAIATPLAPTNSVAGAGIGTSMPEVKFFWLRTAESGDTEPYAISVVSGALSASTEFNVTQPGSSMAVTALGTIGKPFSNRQQGFTAVPSGQYDAAGKPIGEAIEISGQVDTPSLGLGKVKFVQLVTRSSTTNTMHAGRNDNNWVNQAPAVINDASPVLDTADPYPILKGLPAGANTVFATGVTKTMTDSPLVYLQGQDPTGKFATLSYSRADRFQAYMMYQPIGGVWVPMRAIGWNYSSNGTWVVANKAYTVTGGLSADSFSLSPYDEPEWSAST